MYEIGVKLVHVAVGELLFGTEVVNALDEALENVLNDVHFLRLLIEALNVLGDTLEG